ncbi:hypothetical protein [Azospirillum griseum]|uniref:Uncharacterized protein n=1 Tax=Azospirillum griseum TaxID=2496639 RepID=A0A3S0L1A6_9PROT|nr:hypothetical protein [Azospirillum griseum]RTR24247.1 hypothetical protein EJ903_00205 [Azospirillum griseum]
MAVIYVARSAALTAWASDVGQGKHSFKLGVAEDEASMKAAIAAGWGGESDWKLVLSQSADGVTEDEALARLTRREKTIDPGYYPRLKGATGIFRVSVANVQRSLLMAQAMDPDQPMTDVKVKPKDIAAYLIRNALA